MPAEDKTEQDEQDVAGTAQHDQDLATTGEPVYNDRDKLDFDPDDGLFSGTAVDGGTSIPGEHQMVDDVPEEDADSGSEQSDSDESDSEHSDSGD